jgi:hypothetical protein
VGALDEAGVYFGSPAEAEADLNSRTFRNSLEERLYRDGRKKIIDEQVAPIRDGAAQLMEQSQQDADEGDEAAQAHLVAVQDLREQMKNREITPKEARTEIAKLNKEAERLAILAETLPNDYAKALHDRDHPRDVLEFLYRTYPVGPMRFDF